MYLNSLLITLIDSYATYHQVVAYIADTQRMSERRAKKMLRNYGIDFPVYLHTHRNLPEILEERREQLQTLSLKG